MSPELALQRQAVKDLREKTGAGMMDCKKALRETQGDVQAAIGFLRKKGLAGADKKAGRAATEGLVASYIHAGSGYAQSSLLYMTHSILTLLCGIFELARPLGMSLI